MNLTVDFCQILENDSLYHFQKNATLLKLSEWMTSETYRIMVIIGRYAHRSELANDLTKLGASITQEKGKITAHFGKNAIIINSTIDESCQFDFLLINFLTGVRPDTVANHMGNQTPTHLVINQDQLNKLDTSSIQCYNSLNDQTTSPTSI